MNLRETTIQSLVTSGVLEVGDGYRTKRPEHGEPGYRIIRVADVRDESVHLDGSDFVSESFVSQIGAKAAQAGDVLLTTKGTVGRTAVMPETTERAVYSPQLCYFRVRDENILLPGFLRYWLRSYEFQSQSAFLQGNTDMAPYISLTDLRSARISLPAISDQQAIAEVLGSIDDKIAANTKLATTADELVRGWYSDLRDNADSWVTLEDSASSVRNLVEPNSASGHYVGLEHIPRRTLWLDSHGSVDDVTSTKAAFRAGDVLFGKLRPYFHKVSVAPWSGVASTDVLVLRARDASLRGLVMAAASSDEAIARANAASEGTRMPRAKWADIAGLEVPAPSERVRDVSVRIDELRLLVEARIAESQTLAATRDALLPALMSGRLRVRDAERIVDDVRSPVADDVAGVRLGGGRPRAV